jgi:hypothetical protein
MSADNEINVSRQTNANARIIEAINSMTESGEKISIRSVSRKSGAHVKTVTDFLRRWKTMRECQNAENNSDDIIQNYRERINVFMPHTVDDYLQSVWKSPITAETIVRWYIQMMHLHRLYSTGKIRIAHTTYRTFADWINEVKDYMQQQYNPDLLFDMVHQWEGNIAETLLTDGAIAGIKLPSNINNYVAETCK